MGGRSSLGKALQMGQEETSRAGRSRRALPGHGMLVAAGDRAGQGLRAQLSVREQLSGVSRSTKCRSACSAGWARSHPAPCIPQGQGQGRGASVGRCQPCCPVEVLLE